MVTSNWKVRGNFFFFTGGGLYNFTVLLIVARLIDALLYWDLSRSDRDGELKNYCPHLK
jgi:hypothetical protein